MARFPSLPENPHLADVFQRFPKGIWSLMKFHDHALRGESELTVGEREMIAAYVSALNSCGFCHGTHAAVAELHGIETTLLEKLIENPESTDLEPRWLPLLSYLRKLTEIPARLTDKDAEEVFNAGWSEETFFDAIVITALFNFSNRIVEGCGVSISEEHLNSTRDRHKTMIGKSDPYQTFGRLLGINPDE